MKIQIAVLTYDREASLKRCIHSLEQAINHTDFSVKIVIGDNFPASIEESTYSKLATRLHIGLGSVAAGRQFLLSNARQGGYDYLAFIDDDEVVGPCWLARMVAVAESQACAAVAGPVSPVDLPVAHLPLHNRKRHATGTVVASAGAGNLLLNLRVAKETNFDRGWALPGGEDTDFTLRLGASEGQIVWCDEGEVFEPVRPDRLSRRWLLRRYFLNGRILYRAHAGVFTKKHFVSLPSRFAAMALSSFRLLFQPLSPVSFRFFLDHGVRNAGYVFEVAAQLTTQSVLRIRSLRFNGR